MIKIVRTFFLLLITFSIVHHASCQIADSTQTYKKRVLESIEIDFLSSVYLQDGENAAVTGGIGSESLVDGASAIVISIPLNYDDILTIDASVSAYSSASSSNINPFDGKKNADPFVASSGASRQDVWSSYTASYSHSSDDRNEILLAKATYSMEYDYVSFGFGGGFSKLFNQKNTEVSVTANLFFDQWKHIYPVELRGIPGNGGEDDEEEEDDFNINNYTITGNPNYSPTFKRFTQKARNSYSLGLVLSQIMSKNLQGSLAFDFVLQNGLLSTPFQRVYFSDFEDSFIENFHLADDVERLPDTRFKFAGGGRLNYYINEIFIIRTFFRYYSDDWGILSYTANAELPIKLADRFTLYPSYRFYNQTESIYFLPYNQHLSTNLYYTSDYDLSNYWANQYSLGITYTDIFTQSKLWRFGLKSVDLKYSYYRRNSNFYANILTFSFKFVFD